jgi:phosphoserine phosphatase RsbU/P
VTRWRPGGGTVIRWTGAFALLTAAFVADVATGGEVSSSLDYVIAVAYAAWFLGRAEGIGMAVLSALAWLAAYFVVGRPFSQTAVLLWNVSAEVAIYSAMAVLLGSLREHVVRVRALADRLAEANHLLDREAQAVGRLQRELLPAAPPSIPGYAWAVHYETSTRAGGDYYDFVTRPDGHVGVLIADASGHGAPAAVLMAMTRTLLHAVAASAPTPAAVLARLNRQLGRLLPAGWFVTACYAILDPGSGALVYSLAGHDPPFVLRARDRSLEPMPPRGGPMLGPWSEATFESGETRLGPGDALVLHTDGLTEAADPAGRLLGLPAVLAAVASVPDLRPETIRTRVLELVTSHRAGAAVSDDLTLMVLGREA